MKRKHLFSISLLSIFSFCLTAQTSWTRLTPTPQESTINCMKKIPGTNKLVAVGGGSTIMFSDDNGTSWETRNNPAGKDNDYVCYSVFFFNSNVGFISGSKESILKTLDGGLTWTEVYSGSTIYSWSGYFDFVFSDPATGVAVGSMGKIIRTTDGGNTWIEVNSGVDFQLNAVDICLSQKLIAVGADDEHYLVSPDAGLTWEIITIENSMQYGNFSDVKFITSSTGLACISGSSNKVLRTIDAGETWEVVYSGSYSPQAIDNYEDMHIAISCHREIYESGVIVSDDGGLSWTEFPNGGFSNGAAQTIVVTSQVTDFIMAGNMGMIYGSDGAGNWEDLYERTFWGDIYQVQFLDENTGFAMAEGHQGGVAYSQIFLTLDGGLTWSYKGGIGSYSGSFFAISPSIYMIADNYLDQLVLSMTSNGGINWTLVYTGFDFDPFCMKFYDQYNGLITGEGNVVKRSDTGVTWQQVITGSGGWWNLFYDIEYRSADDVILVGDKVYVTTFINKSTDGGLTWQGDSIGDYGAGRDVFFADDNTAFIACQNNMILKSTDGGETWNETTLNNLNPIEFHSIHFPSLNTGYAVGNGPFETILKTTDGGETWNPINAHTTSGLNSVYFSDDNTGLIFGEGGVVLKTTTGGITGFEESSFSGSGNLMEIYPNPSSDEVNICISLPLFNTAAQLIIYNCNGEKIESLPFSGSTESLIISTGTLKPGIYFCQLKTDSGVIETRKLIKL